MKEELRKRYKALRNSFSGVGRKNADMAIAEKFMAMFGLFDSYFMYNSIGGEADTGLLIAALLAEGNKVFLPRTENGNIVPVPYGPMVKGAYGINEPVGEAYGGYAAVTAVPLLCINSRGYRLGYGGGYYDRYLKDARTIKVGIGYSFQLTDDFIEDELDVPLDLFLNEKGVLCFSEKSLALPDRKI